MPYAPPIYYLCSPSEKQKSVLVLQHDTDFRMHITVAIAAD